MFKKSPRTKAVKPIDEIMSAEARIQAWMEKEISPESKFNPTLNFYENIESGELLLKILQRYFSNSKDHLSSDQICLDFSTIKRNSPQFISKSKSNLSQFISFSKEKLAIHHEMTFEDIFLQKNKRNILVFLTQFMIKCEDAKNRSTKQSSANKDFDSVLDEMEEDEKTSQKQEKEIEKIVHAVSDDEDDDDEEEEVKQPISEMDLAQSVMHERKKVEEIKESPLILSESTFRASPLRNSKNSSQTSAFGSANRLNKPLPQVPNSTSPEIKQFPKRNLMHKPEKSIDLGGVERVVSSVFSPNLIQVLEQQEAKKKIQDLPENKGNVEIEEEEDEVAVKKIMKVSDLFNAAKISPGTNEYPEMSSQDFTIVSLIQQLFRFFLLPVVLLEVFFMQFAAKREK